MFDTIINYVFMFFVFSAIGWAIECTYRSLGERRIINSGFLYGPMCPIYGTGCLVFDVCLVPISAPIEKRLILVLLLGMLLADIVEYATSYIMEKLFNARWWDYSNRKFNIKNVVGANDYESMREDGSLDTVHVELDSRLTPAANAQRYYKKYNKSKNAKVELAKQISEEE